MLAGVGMFWLSIFFLPQARMGFLAPLSVPAIGVFALGLILRWYAILRLGSFFTVEVAITAGHKLVDTGLFGLVRHPSYAGLLLMLLAIGIRSGNIAALALLMAASLGGLLQRMRVEEAALSAAFPEYVDYMRRTKRLVPFLY